MSDTPRSMTRRPSRALATTLLAVVLLVVGGLGAWLLGDFIATDQWPSPVRELIQDVSAVRMGSPAVAAIACVLVALGLLMIVLALWPGRPRYVAVLSDEVPGQTVVSRHDLATLIKRKVEQVDGVSSTTVTTRRARADIRVSTPLGDTPVLRDEVRSAAQDALDHIRPELPLSPRVHVRHTS